MTITFDEVNNKATDDASGMAVAYMRDDYPLERGEFWTLAWKGREHAFRVGWDDGYQRISRERKDLSVDERSKLANELHLLEYTLPMIASLTQRDFLNNIDLFIELFSTVARKRFHSRSVHVIFQPWGISEQYHREVRFPPLDAGDAVQPTMISFRLGKTTTPPLGNGAIREEFEDGVGSG